MVSGERNRWLDILRAAAIVLVVNCHIASDCATSFGSSPVYLILGIGGHGVDLFFVLSGWLLGKLLFKELGRTGSIRIKRFLMRRWLRTLPAYYVVLFATMAQALVQGRLESQHLSYPCFGQTYLLERMPFFGVSWSLCVEEHFYLLIAPLILLVGNRRRLGILLFAALLVIPLLCRSMEWYSTLSQTHVRLDQCAAGVGLAFIFVQFPGFWARIQGALPVLALLAVIGAAISILNRFLSLPFSIPLTLYTFISIVLVAYSERGRWWQGQIRIPFANYLATRSYSIYLLHVEAIAIVKRLEVESVSARWICIWLVSLCLAEVLFRFIELPGMRLRENSWFKTQIARDT